MQVHGPAGGLRSVAQGKVEQPARDAVPLVRLRCKWRHRREGAGAWFTTCKFVGLLLRENWTRSLARKTKVCSAVPLT